MMEPNFSLGPWYVPGPYDLSEESKAKAKLADAAPELLAVADMILQLATIETPKELIRMAEQAIAKAKGENHD